MPYGWQGNCTYGIAVACFTDFIGLRKGDEHSAYTPVRSMAPFIFLIVSVALIVPGISSWMNSS